MATGRIRNLSLKTGQDHFRFAVGLLLFPAAAWALDVGLAGVMSGKALLMIDGREPTAVAVGQTLGNVKLVSLQGDQAVVEVDGKKRPLRVGQNATGSVGSGERIILTADSAGHFMTTGAINQVAVRFLVDTGATMVSLGATDARRLGIDPAKGQRGVVSTANGQVTVSKVTLDSVRIGDVTLHNVEALVHPGELPVVLLGMSFLNRMDMQRDGATMTLKRRF
ncbi:MAG: TIGR02281 family clan AA aspartic protease [Betaproteobacteria bacterium]